MHTELPCFADRLRRGVYNDTVREYLKNTRSSSPTHL